MKRPDHDPDYLAWIASGAVDDERRGCALGCGLLLVAFAAGAVTAAVLIWVLR